MFLLKNKRKYNSLAIIGNGFDLAHGYKTNYADFIENTKDIDLETFKKLCNSEKIETWYDFEKNINIMSLDLYQKNFNGDVKFDAVSDNLLNLNKIFARIHKLLLNYLKSETDRIPVGKLKSIKKSINKKTKVINFNYTKVAEAYTEDVFYVHGSIDENNIILGYDYRDEHCLISMEYMYWFKKYRRELMAFERYLQIEKCVNPESLEYKSLIENFEKYQMYANSGRGIDEEVELEIAGFKQIDDFICNKCENKLIPDIDYSKIKTITIMGHGIESDKEFLKDILKRCTKLRKIIIFRYCGEREEVFNCKSQFFEPYCKKIYSKYY